MGSISPISLFRVLRRLWDLDREGHRLVALLVSISRDPLLAATAPYIVFLPINAEFQRDPMKAALQTCGRRAAERKYPGEGLPERGEHVDPVRASRRPHVQEAPVGESDTDSRRICALSRPCGWISWRRNLRLCLASRAGRDPSQARHLALEAKRGGLLDLRMSGEVVELSLSRLDPSSARS